MHLALPYRLADCRLLMSGSGERGDCAEQEVLDRRDRAAPAEDLRQVGRHADRLRRCRAHRAAPELVLVAHGANLQPPAHRCAEQPDRRQRPGGFLERGDRRRNAFRSDRSPDPEGLASHRHRQRAFRRPDDQRDAVGDRLRRSFGRALHGHPRSGRAGDGPGAVRLHALQQPRAAEQAGSDRSRIRRAAGAPVAFAGPPRRRGRSPSISASTASPICSPPFPSDDRVSPSSWTPPAPRRSCLHGDGGGARARHSRRRGRRFGATGRCRQHRRNARLVAGGAGYHVFLSPLEFRAVAMAVVIPRTSISARSIRSSGRPW